MPVSINGNTGVITGVAVGGLPDGIVDADMLASGVGGKLLQVVSTTRTDTFSENLGVGAVSSDALTVNITPSNANNKIFLTAHVSMGLNNDNEVNWVFL